MIVELLGVAKSKGLTPAQTVLFLALTEMLEGGRLVRLTAEELSEATGLSPNSVRRGLDALTRAGLVERNFNNLFAQTTQIGYHLPKLERTFNDLCTKTTQIGYHLPKLGSSYPNWQPPALPSPFVPPLGIPPYNPPNPPTPQPACARVRPAQVEGEKEREVAGSLSGVHTAENAPESPTQPAPISGNAPNYPLECPKFPFVTQGGISLPPTAQNRVKGHFTPDERDFLKTYGKQPLTNDAFNAFVTAFSEAVQDVGLQRLIECARMEVENVRAENGGSSQKLRRPEVWLADLAYRDWLSKIPATNQPTASTDAYMRYLDTLDLGL